MEKNLGSSGRDVGETYSCVASGCSCEYDLINAVSLSPALPPVSWGGEKGGFVWSG